MTNRIYYVGARVSIGSAFLLRHFFGSSKLKLHSTIIYSCNVWFPYREAKFFPLIIEPPYTVEEWNKEFILRYYSDKIFQRYIELRSLGAHSDYPDFKSHITLGDYYKTGRVPNFPIRFDREYYQTWEEEKP